MADDAQLRGYATDPGPLVAAAFKAVHETRMHGVPILNPAIGVEAVGFAPWDAHWLGCLVTPWFMNLMLLPREPDRWVRLRPGEKHRYVFAAGTFEFIGGREEAIGEYQACSLFSPMFEFADHETARLTAEACLKALSDPENREPAELPRPETPADGASIAARLEMPLSKRDLLRGRFLGRDPGG